MMVLFLKEVAKIVTAGLSPVSGLNRDFLLNPQLGLKLLLGLCKRFINFEKVT
jgi:hypothetical protein